MLMSVMSDIIEAPILEELSITYHNSDTVDSNIYYNEEGYNEAEILDYKSIKTISSGDADTIDYEFLGWSIEEDSTVVTYKVGDKVTLSENLDLYPVLQEIEEESESTETEITEEETETSEIKEISESSEGNSEMKEISSENSDL